MNLSYKEILEFIECLICTYFSLWDGGGTISSPPSVVVEVEINKVDGRQPLRHGNFFEGF